MRAQRGERLRRAEGRLSADAERLARGSGLRPSTTDDMRAFLLSARAQGRTLRLRLQAPPLVVALVCFVAPLVITRLLRRSAVVETATYLFFIASVTGLLFAPQPSRRYEEVAASAAVSAMGAVVSAVVVLALHNTVGVARVRPCAAPAGCCGLADAARSARLLVGAAPCWFLEWHLVWRHVYRASCTFAFLLVAVALVARFVHAPCASRGAPRAPRELLDGLWTALGRFSGALTLSEGFHALAMLALGLYARNGLELGLICVRIAVSAAFAAFALRAHLRDAAHSWLASRGESVTTAVGIATLIGSRAVDDVQATAIAQLRSLRIDLLHEADLASSQTDARLYALSSPAKYGEVDAFISHSWRDDGAVKWASLQRWRADFKRSSSGREPTVWLDKACLSPGDLDTQLALLPVFVASCKSFVVLLTPSYLERLWCVVELFVWLHVGDAQSTVLLCSGFPPAASESAPPSPAPDSASPAPDGASPAPDGALPAPDGALPAPDGVLPAPDGAASPAIDGYERQCEDEQKCIARTAAGLGSFSVLRASCEGRRTADRLRSVIEIGCGGLEQFDAIARLALGERLDAMSRLLELQLRRVRRTTDVRSKLANRSLTLRSTGILCCTPTAGRRLAAAPSSASSPTAADGSSRAAKCAAESGVGATGYTPTAARRHTATQLERVLPHVADGWGRGASTLSDETAPRSSAAAPLPWASNAANCARLRAAHAQHSASRQGRVTPWPAKPSPPTPHGGAAAGRGGGGDDDDHVGDGARSHFGCPPV